MILSTSAIVLSSFTEIRSAPCILSGGTPIACNTCDGFISPVVHALPAETQIPSASIFMTSASLSIPSKHILSVPGTCQFILPLMQLFGIFDNSSAILSRIRVTLTMLSTIRSQHSSSAAAIPTIPATFSVPPRSPFSCSPPSMNFPNGQPSRIYKAPTPFGPWNLCPDIDNMSIFISSTLMGTCPTACTASVWNSIPLFLHNAPIDCIGCIVPTSLFAYIIEIITVFGRIAAVRSDSFTSPLSLTGIYVTSHPCCSNLSTE